ncbi:MAG: GGDEF domain-containing phosphodiesterase [Clostridium sp.]|nr:GGDEF domain-containing phosphodiesterase [Clostridium sp.]MCM1547088.1 GGDEF domain-containing phosphodiesterase [Ruminococcus sp.]
MYDPEEYALALDELIEKFQNIKNFQNTEETQDALENICQILRIGSIEVFYFLTLAHEKSGNADPVFLYDSGNAGTENAVGMRESMENGAVTRYIFHPIKDGDDWTRLELKRIKTLQRLIFAYGGRSNLLIIANNLTYNDMQLGIPNLTFFMRTADELISKGLIGRYSAAYINLRRFSIINNQVGRDEGTVIMKKYVHGLKKRLSDDEYVCRIGGDNFALLFFKEHLNEVSEYLSGINIKSDKFETEFLVSTYSGFYDIIPSECKSPEYIMDRTALAFNVAKKNPNTPFIFYNVQIHENVRRAKKIEDLVPYAIDNEEFLVYYQPKVDVNNCVLVGAEALCRWSHDDELIAPAAFIPVLERSKLICELDFYMLDHVCRDIRRWLDEGKRVVKVSVNLSRVHLGEANLLDEIINTIDRHWVPHKYIEIELTETTTDVDYNELKNIVVGLREAGISTSVDDFGIGYSSLNLIRELPWNVLKIDKSFLPDGSGNEEQKRTMLKYVIAMAKALGLECIVEGVETSEHVSLLKENGCCLAQGFYFDKPLPVDTFEEKLPYEDMSE